jgi:hypothetical protein
VASIKLVAVLARGVLAVIARLAITGAAVMAATRQRSAE